MTRSKFKYVDDPFCGHDMSLGFWKAAAKAFVVLKSRRTYAKFPTDLPVAVFAGGEDFCTVDDLGEVSYRRIQKELSSAKKTPPKIVIYPGARHEIMLETNSAEVHQDMLAFLTNCLRQRPVLAVVPTVAVLGAIPVKQAW